MAIKIYDEIDKNPSTRKLVEFGAIFLAGTGVIGLVYQFYLHKEPIAHGLWIAGAVVFLLSLIRPIGRILYILWMGLGITMGLITSPIILVVVFLFLITPVGLIFRIIGRDAMKRKLDPGATTYWEEYKESEDPATYVKQF